MRRRRNYKLTAPPLAALVALAIAAGWAAAQTPAPNAFPVEVQVDGVDGDLERNVLAMLSIAHPRTKTITEPEARALHERAPNEIELALQPFGFYRPSVWSDFAHEAGRWRASYRIELGPPLRVDSLVVRLTGEGRADPAFGEVLGDPPLAEGDVLVHAHYDALRQRLTSTAMRSGYIDARFVRHEIRVDVERNVAAVVLELATGPRWVYGPVTFQQDVVHPELVEGYVRFQRGAPVDYGKLLELEQSLDNSPYWSRVEVRPRRDLARGAELPIAVTLEPVKPRKFTVGVGYGTDNGPHGRGLVELRRVNRSGHRAELEGTLSTIEQSGAFRYHQPWPYPRTDLLTYSIGYSAVHTETSDDRTGFVGAQFNRLWAGWQETFGLHYRRQRWSVGIDGDVSSFVVPEANWSRFRTDDPIDPSDGSRLRFGISGAHRSAYSAATYGRLDALARWLRAFAPRQRLIARLEAGHTWTSDFHRLPPNVRFFAGGAQSVRGYGFNRLGPRDAGGFVSGGTVLALASLEYELRFLPRWGVAAFYDAGNTMREFSDPLAHGAGGGLRWASPIGMVRADLGVPLRTGDRAVQFHVSIGPSL